jgi:choline dehydrogenase-like flavoprotein
VSAERAERVATQVLVIGSGAGGAITAATLAEAGYEVLIAEEGPAVDTARLATHTPGAMRLLYRNGGMAPILGKSNIAFVQGRCVGGSTEINSAFWHRTPVAAIERWRAEFGVRELDPDLSAGLFEEIESTVGVSLLKAPTLPPSSAAFKRGAERLGYGVEEVPRAQPGRSVDSAFAPGAKHSMSRTYLPRALRAGAKLLAGCTVKRLEHRAGRVARVEAVREAGGERSRLAIEPQAVFVCGGATQTPALLRSSGIKRNVGDNLRIHPMLKVAALFDERFDSHRAPLPVHQIRGFADLTLGGAVFTPGFLALTLSENWAVNQSVLGDWRKTALYYVSCRGSNRGSVRVFPFGGEPVVRYSLSELDRRNLGAGLARLGEVLFAGGARRLFPALSSPAALESAGECRALGERLIPAASMGLSTVHIFSSCPMGEDPDRAATDSFGKVRGFENLYLGDASLLPDSPGINPQGTVMMIALRNARHFAQTAACR